MPQTNLPVDILHWLLAALPIVIFLFFLVALRWKGTQVAPVAMFTAIGVALLFFRMDFFELAVSVGKGVWDAIFILIVVWTALLLYRVIDAAGGFAALRAAMTKVSSSELFLILLFAWGFTSFLQGITGFGVPIAIVAPILVGFGVKPVYAVVMPLIAHVWGKLFGSLGEGWLATIQLVDVQDPTATALQTALLLWIPDLLGGLAIAWFFGRWAAVRYALPLILVVSAIHGGVQAAMVFVSPTLSMLTAGALGLLAFIPLARWRYSKPATEEIPEEYVLVEGNEPGVGSDEIKGPEPVVSTWMAVLPFVVLIVVALFVVVIDPVSNFLGQFTFGLPFPAIETGYGVASPAESAYSPLALLTHPGAFILVATLVTWVVYRRRGYYERWSERTGQPVVIGSAVVKNAVPSSLTITSLLILSGVMASSGQIEVLGLGIAAVAPALAYAFLASWIGALGAFITGSSTSSQLLFTPLQNSVGGTLNLPQSAILAAQGAGGCIGNAIAPANIALGTSSVGKSGEDASVMRLALPWTLITVAIVGLATILLVAIS